MTHCVWLEIEHGVLQFTVHSVCVCVCVWLVSQCMAGTLGLMVHSGLTVYGIAGTLGIGSHDGVSWLEHH